MYLNAKTKACLQTWVSHIPRAFAVYDERTPQATVFTDSSTTGWGIYWEQGDLEYGEEWPIEQQSWHINILELKAVLLALLMLVKHLRNKHIQLFIDNTTAISCIKKGGSTKSFTCNAVTQDIFKYAWSKGITFILAYIPTKENVRADRASRGLHIFRGVVSVFRYSA